MFIIIWEFIVGRGNKSDFEKAYGSEGDWVKLFKNSENYLGTDLLQDEKNPHRYVTIDSWVSSGAYENFKRTWGKEYQELDERCKVFTENERLIGEFTA